MRKPPDTNLIPKHLRFDSHCSVIRVDQTDSQFLMVELPLGRVFYPYLDTLVCGHCERVGFDQPVSLMSLRRGAGRPS